MFKILGKFVFHFLIYAFFLALLVWIFVQNTDSTIWLSEYFEVLFIFQFFLTIIVYSLSIFGIQKGGEYAVFTILGGVVIKLLLSLSLFLVVYLKGSDNQIVLGLNFFSIYLLLTCFEVIYLLRNLRHQN